jgi:hypothetical protein
LRYSDVARWLALVAIVFAAVGWGVVAVRQWGDIRVAYPGVQNLQFPLMFITIILGALAGGARKGLGRIALALGLFGLAVSTLTMVSSRLAQ